MPLEQALMVSKMIEEKFSEIQMTINPEEEILNEWQLNPTENEKVLVVFRIPSECACLSDFFRDFCETLNKESETNTTSEKE